MKPQRPQTQVPDFKPISDMKPIYVLVAFYAFVLLLLAGTSYIVFVMNKTPWLYGIALIVVLECKPKVMNIFKPKGDE